MDYHQDPKSPDKGVWAVLIVFLVAVLMNVGGKAWETPGAIVILVICGWSVWTVGRWAWLRFGGLTLTTRR
jgi:hypothetical protein